jgi:uncharacterized surface protein with fasciclin (FAS1) repeats
VVAATIKMFSKYLSVAALAGYAFAQQNTPSLAEALNSTSDLSQLAGVLGLVPELVQALSSANNITILAPSNAAFDAIGNETLTALASDQDMIAAILQYHVLNGTIRSDQITNTSAFVPTLLTNPQYTNVTGGQVVQAVERDGNVTFFSGLLANSTVSQADVNFTGGVIHIIDRLLVLPVAADETLSAANLTALRGALNATELTETVNTTPNITVFAPTNEAIQDIGSALANLTTEQITDVLTYHVVAGTIGYSSGLENGTELTAVNGDKLTIVIGDGGVFVNNAKVVVADVLIANGVVHVIDQVLNPTNATLAQGTEEEGQAAYSGASAASDVPFTSGVPTASTTIGSEATSAANPTAGSSSSSTAGAHAPMKTGAVGMSALLGAAAAVYFV